MPTQVTIDSLSGFCPGVVTAIRKAENHLAAHHQLYCLGDIVHNTREVERLEKQGLKTISYDDYKALTDATVLLRAHGEPPNTYQTARLNNITLIDASCPVVLKLQQRIRAKYLEGNCQIIIYGKKGHAEVVGLVGQTEGNAIVVEQPEDMERIDFTRDIALFSQTTKSIDGFRKLVDEIKKRFTGKNFEYFDTICRQVANRIPNIESFARQQDAVIFVGDTKSSNGRVLYEHCRNANPETYFIADAQDLTEDIIQRLKGKKVGISGATSTPRWLMEAVAKKIK
ncbi:MAG: 4-hydroxy-3-methylbut-2-enyl diphosphate reductase [Paludibacteraceae bacterium]|nr:4-hydroxy-3-methylbut-2-enyl diphosphate reductase [Paludibacteraceae bacterium]